MKGEGRKIRKIIIKKRKIHNVEYAKELEKYEDHKDIRDLSN